MLIERFFKKFEIFSFFLKKKNKFSPFKTVLIFFSNFVLFPYILIQLFSLNLFFNYIGLANFRWFWCIYFPVCTYLIYRDYAHKGWEECYIFAFYLSLKIIFIFLFKLFKNYF